MAKTPDDCIESVAKSKSKLYRVLLKSGIMLQSVVLNDNMKGMKFDKVYVDPAINDLIVKMVLYPVILHDPRNIIIEDN